MQNVQIEVENLRLGQSIYLNGAFTKIGALCHSIVMRSEAVTVYTDNDLPTTFQYGDVVEALIERTVQD